MLNWYWMVSPQALAGTILFAGEAARLWDEKEGATLGPDGAVCLTNSGTSPTTGEVLKLTVTPCR